ncbi:glycosyltransferase family 2 protein [Telmatocola sphagniphila]|uniref:Glycosyltransferase family 2 protein n=1 Tax=Telmatocola sphagniphila TaxID=1123043 RepID=A0A8E6ESQ5_9BACT|nr:glycosyltransferase family 2 protein [Telmatocola sphagniphila]QVL31144.1 glycosyltransferase family 2 protein [Telmatocola sphagniphila]
MNPVDPAVWIVVLNFNGWEDTIKCLASLEPIRNSCAIVLVDNASKENRLDQMKENHPWIHTLPRNTNGGWAGGNNTGIEYALERGAEQIILLNNDTRVSPSLVSTLLEAAAANPTYGVIGPVINFMDDPEVVMTDGCVFNHPGYPGFFERKSVPLENSRTITPVEIVNGCCMMVSRAVFEAIGLIDERFFLIHEESDFCLRAREAGFGCGVLGTSLVWHKGSVSFKRTGSRIQRYYDSRNLRLLLNKHVYRHAEGRNRLESMRTYWKYVYYRYSIERENQSPDSANAVLEGVWDGLHKYYGPLEKRNRWGVPVLRGVFEFVRKLSN